jgi:putative transposase
VHKTARVLAALPKRLHPRAKELLHAISYADLTHRRARRRQGVRRRAVRPPQGGRQDHRRARRAAHLLRLPRAALEAPAHHQPDRVDLLNGPARTRVTKGAGNRQAAVAMAYKLLDAAQDRWRRIRAPELVPLVRAGATFIDGQLQERSDNPTDQHDEDTDEVRAA